jgi:hypothetical protein
VRVAGQRGTDGLRPSRDGLSSSPGWRPA